MADIRDIKVGLVFSTPFETNCVVTSEPDETGNFEAFDSEGVKCQFHVVMVTDVWQQVQTGRKVA